ncbi:Crp/Fnr family transcriptional regulator [Chondrinema litorale]|uniref:Crp/Fnr family transcriptional regulator n=1 Tax=Chondrinema litorale TaxID=2994555 RepID=UPI002543BA31|nr:Crp/Fnr family transcriptional regulator [Chondrinema litorale]UZR98544.1 Crp/Fnr family transcriptional regulator [Chondrinema litorale]UZR98927.1 Crp/Fnr family transcriptional regulator [Chondrinema litorale]
MEDFIEYILQFGNLNKQQIDLIKRKAKEIEINKDDYLSEAGKIPRQVGFLLEGIFRFCYYNNRGEEITNYLIDENHFVTDYQNFAANMAASEYVQAVTNCKLLVFSKKDWDELLNTIIGWDKVVSKIVEKCLVQKIEARSPLVSEDATTRYLSFLEKFPTFVNRVPLSYIASYLGITQQSLSRIRKNIR